MTEIQHIPQTHSLRSNRVCQVTRSMWQFAAEHMRSHLLSLFFSLSSNIHFKLNQHPKGGDSSSAQEKVFSPSSQRWLVTGGIRSHRVIDLMCAMFRWDKHHPLDSWHSSISSLSSLLLACWESSEDTE